MSVSELSHDAVDDGFHEIQLSWKQLVFLCMTGTILLVGIFLFGVSVGRGARDVREAEATSASAVSSPDALTPSAGAEPPAVEPPMPAETPEELSYHNRLQGTGAANDSLKKPAPEQPPAQKEQAPKPAPQAPAAVPSDVPTSGRPGTHVIQVFVSRDRSAAVALVKKLGASGYPAFLVAPESPSVPQMFKVQVGRFAEREAEQVAKRLEKEGDFKPWVISSR